MYLTYFSKVHLVLRAGEDKNASPKAANKARMAKKCTFLNSFMNFYSEYQLPKVCKDLYEHYH